MKKYTINFSNANEIQITCVEGVFPEDEIIKWQDTNMLLENITECVDENNVSVDIYQRWIQREQQKAELLAQQAEQENAQL